MTDTNTSGQHVVSEVLDLMSDMGNPEQVTPTGDVREHMAVLGSCGNKLGVVDHVEGDRLKLTKNDSPDGQHHYIPRAWVERVDTHVHLSKNCGEAKSEWTSV